VSVADGWGPVAAAGWKGESERERWGSGGVPTCELGRHSSNRI
jgi:hypothetical protein